MLKIYLFCICLLFSLLCIDIVNAPCLPALEFPITIRAYTPRPCETDSTPFITASNQRVREGIVALSRDLEHRLGLKFGDMIIIAGLGGIRVPGQDAQEEEEPGGHLHVGFARGEGIWNTKRNIDILREGKIMETDKNGCSTTPNNCEQIEKYHHAGQEFVQYDYRTVDGELFSCVAKNLEIAHQRRDGWIQAQLN